MFNKVFLRFVNIISSIEENLENVIIGELKVLGINIVDCHGQLYDNGSNMKRKYKWVKSRILEINNKAWYTPCVGQNLVIGNSVKTLLKSELFHYIRMYIFHYICMYKIFTASTKRLAIQICMACSPYIVQISRWIFVGLQFLVHKNLTVPRNLILE